MKVQDCEFLAVRPDKDGVRRVRKSNYYACNAPEPDTSKFPQSVVKSFYFPINGFTRSYVSPEYCAKCAAFCPRKAREPAKP